MSCSVRVPGSNGTTPTFTGVTGTDAQQLGPGVLKGYAPTDLLLFHGGVVEIEASLLALQGQKYMLFFVEARLDRDDWRRLRAIEEPLAQAIEAMLRGDDDNVASFSRVAL